MVQDHLRAPLAALLAGDDAAAVDGYRDAIAAAPADVDARYGLASALAADGDGAGAGAALEEARLLQGLLLAKGIGVDLLRLERDADYAAAIATQLYAAHHVAAASVIWGRAVLAGHCSATGLLTYALSLQHQGRAEEAIRVFRAAAERHPSAAAAQFQVYPHLFCDNGDKRHFAAAREWSRRYASGAAAAAHLNPDRRGRKLHIGYVAPWFANCQLAQFMAPLLENHDPNAFEVTLYPTDAATETSWPSWIRVRSLGGLDDAQAAAQIRRDGVDVLADCWGHSAGSRLPVFAHRPAPVQVAWVNYVQTTGLTQMDYVLHADALEPLPDLAETFTERIWPIGPVFNAFRANAGRLAPTPTPALRTGQVTFGSFNHPAKLSDATLDGWAAILRGAPDSRLVLKYRYFIDPVLQSVSRACFASRRVHPDRIVFAGHSSGGEYFQAFQEIDLMLDAWPAPGSTTTLDALSNGVPMLVKTTPGAAGHYGRSILEACGLQELIASSPEDFVARAVRLASDVPRLDDVRRRVRPGFDGGACADEAAFTRRVEAAFSEMFDVWFANARGDRAYG